MGNSTIFNPSCHKNTINPEADRAFLIILGLRENYNH
jgi:hypothetical protein